MKARCPDDDIWYFFIDKCLPFGASISCAIFQRWSNALAHLLNYELRFESLERGITNYLDDFLNIALSQLQCDNMTLRFH